MQRDRSIAPPRYVRIARRLDKQRRLCIVRLRAVRDRIEPEEPVESHVRARSDGRRGRSLLRDLAAGPGLTSLKLSDLLRLVHDQLAQVVDLFLKVLPAAARDNGRSAARKVVADFVRSLDRRS